MLKLRHCGMATIGTIASAVNPEIGRHRRRASNASDPRTSDSEVFRVHRIDELLELLDDLVRDDGIVVGFLGVRSLV